MTIFLALNSKRAYEEFNNATNKNSIQILHSVETSSELLGQGPEL